MYEVRFTKYDLIIKRSPPILGAIFFLRALVSLWQYFAHEKIPMAAENVRSKKKNCAPVSLWQLFRARKILMAAEMFKAKLEMHNVQGKNKRKRLSLPRNSLFLNFRFIRRLKHCRVPVGFLNGD
jgi:hypothetical protein